MRRHVGFAIGNGASREMLDLNRLKGQGHTIGCNHLYKTWEPSYLVTLDTEITKEVKAVVAAQTPCKWRHITRMWIDGEGEIRRTWLAVDGVAYCPISAINRGWNNNSGVMAAAFLSEVLKAEVVYLIGIDFFRPVPGKANDIYGINTPYAPGLMRVWDRLTSNNPQTEFVRVGEIHERDLEEYAKIDDMKFIEYKDFPY